MLNNPKLLSLVPDPNPDHLRGGPGHGYTTSCVKKNKSIGAIVFEVRARTDKQTLMHYGAMIINNVDNGGAD